jgi:hypothetical protein
MPKEAAHAAVRRALAYAKHRNAGASGGIHYFRCPASANLTVGVGLEVNFLSEQSSLQELLNEKAAGKYKITLEHRCGCVHLDCKVIVLPAGLQPLKDVGAFVIAMHHPQPRSRIQGGHHLDCHIGSER